MNNPASCAFQVARNRVARIHAVSHESWRIIRCNMINHGYFVDKCASFNRGYIFPFAFFFWRGILFCNPEYFWSTNLSPWLIDLTRMRLLLDAMILSRSGRRFLGRQNHFPKLSRQQAVPPQILHIQQCDFYQFPIPLLLSE